MKVSYQFGSIVSDKWKVMISQKGNVPLNVNEGPFLDFTIGACDEEPVINDAVAEGYEVFTRRDEAEIMVYPVPCAIANTYPEAELAERAHEVVAHRNLPHLIIRFIPIG
jgi:hypothetical protein